LLIPELPSSSGCVPGQVEVTMPQAGEVSGVVPWSDSQSSELWVLQV
jgi:hypothetical protein